MIQSASLAAARAAYGIEADCIREMLEFFDDEAFSRAVEMLAAAPRIGAAGCGHSGIACQHFAHLMCCIERPARFISPAEAVHGATGFLQRGDVMLLASRGGKTKELLGASSAMLLNALKALSGIPDSVQLISAEIIEPVQALKVRYFGNRNPRLHMDEVLIALSICAATDERAARALSCLSMLEDCEAHASVILASVDETIFRRLKVNLTSEPNYETKRLYHR